MCYNMNCQFQNYHGECQQPRMQGTPLAKCSEQQQDNEPEKEAEDDD